MANELFQVDNLNDLGRAFYNPESEATSLIDIDMLLIACRIEITKRYEVEAGPGLSPAGRTPLPLCVLPELALGVEVIDPETSLPVRVNGRADWGVAYRGRGDPAEEGARIGVVEAKGREMFSTAEAQLVLYICMLEQSIDLCSSMLCSRNSRDCMLEQDRLLCPGMLPSAPAISIPGNCQGASDQAREEEKNRTRFFQRRNTFRVRNTGIIPKSDVFTSDHMFNEPSVLKTIFNFTLTLFDNSMKSTPQTSPTVEPSRLEWEIEEYDKLIWAQAYRERRGGQVTAD